MSPAFLKQTFAAEETSTGTGRMDLVAWFSLSCFQVGPMGDSVRFGADFWAVPDLKRYLSWGQGVQHKPFCRGHVTTAIDGSISRCHQLLQSSWLCPHIHGGYQTSLCVPVPLAAASNPTITQV